MSIDKHDQPPPSLPPTTCSASYDLHLYSDSKWKEKGGLSKLEIILDDERNPCADFADLGEGMQFGKDYRVTLLIEPIGNFSQNGKDHS